MSAVNERLKTFDKEVSLSKSYLAKQSKPAQGRLSPIDGEIDQRWNMREADQGRRRGGRFGGRGSYPIPDKMED